MSISNGSGPLYVASCGTGSLTVSNNAMVNCGTLDISRNANSNSSGSAGTVYLDGGTLIVNDVTNASSNAQAGGSPTAAFYFNGGTLALNTFFQGSRVAPIMPITTIVQSGGAIINAGGGDVVSMGEPLQHDPALGNTQDGGLTKLGIGTLVLTAANTYNGNTAVSDGRLALTGSASIADSPNIIIGGSGFVDFDVTGLSSTFTLSPGQTLSNSTPMIIIVGNISAASGTLSLAYTPGSPSLLLSNNVLTVTPATTLKIDNTGAPLGVGTYVIISTNRLYYGNTGMVSGTLPSSFTLNGGGTTPGTTASLQINGGVLNLVVTPVPMPRITSVSLHGTTLTLTATNGVANGQYILLESTNIVLPLSQWTPVLTNDFDNNGDLNLSTNIVSPNNPMEFYILSP